MADGPVPEGRDAPRLLAFALLVAGELLLLPAPVTWASSAPRLACAIAAGLGGAALLAWARLGPIAGYMLQLVGLAALPRPGRRLLLLVAAPAAALGVALLALLALSAVLPHPPPTPSATRAGDLLAGGTPLAVGHVVAIAVMEEVAFRGPVVLLARTWASSQARLAAVVFASAVVFAAAHAAYGWLNVTHACVQGLMWSSLAVVSRSLWPSIAAHALFDAVALLA